MEATPLHRNLLLQLLHFRIMDDFSPQMCLIGPVLGRLLSRPGWGVPDRKFNNVNGLGNSFAFFEGISI